MRVKLISFVLTAIFSVAVHAGDTDPERRHPSDAGRSAVITSKIKAELAQYPESALTKVEVEVDDSGKVTLVGVVTSQHEADGAVEIAHAVKGVTGVTSRIDIKPKS